VQGLSAGGPDAFYAWGSPAARLPIGVPQVLGHRLSDTTVRAAFRDVTVRLARLFADPLP
jgi:hypothetical protein